MRRTLLVTLDYPPMLGGVANYYQNLVAYLPEDRIFVLDDSRHELLSTWSWIWPKWLVGLMNTWRAIRRYNIQHILVGQVLPVGTIVWLLSFIAPITYTVMTHAMDVTIPYAPDVTTRKRWLLGKIFRRAEHVVTVSDYTRSHLIKLGIPKERITVIYPCPNVDGGKEPYSSVSMESFVDRHQLMGQKVILSVGRLVERKGFDSVIAGLARVKAEFPNAIYVLVGEGPDRDRLEMLAREHGVANSVRMVGAISDEELARWYTQCDLFVMASRELSNRDVEGFGITFIEASSFGKPVIGGMSGGISDAVVDGETGFLVDSTDVEMLADAIVKLLSEPERSRELGEQGRERVAKEFRWRVQADRLAELIGEIE